MGGWHHESAAVKSAAAVRSIWTEISEERIQHRLYSMSGRITQLSKENAYLTKWPVGSPHCRPPPVPVVPAVHCNVVLLDFLYKDQTFIAFSSVQSAFGAHPLLLRGNWSPHRHSQSVRDRNISLWFVCHGAVIMSSEPSSWWMGGCVYMLMCTCRLHSSSGRDRLVSKTSSGNLHSVLLVWNELLVLNKVNYLCQESNISWKWQPVTVRLTPGTHIKDRGRTAPAVYTGKQCPSITTMKISTRWQQRVYFDYAGSLFRHIRELGRPLEIGTVGNKAQSNALSCVLAFVEL